MTLLYQRLAEEVAQWRDEGYPTDGYEAIGEILRWAAEPEGAGFRLRVPQLRALETYWYLRVVLRTPHVFDLYLHLFPPDDDCPALLGALGIPTEAFQRCNFKLDRLWERVRSDDDFVREFKLEALRETLNLQYPSYILALAMGAGKTVLIGAIIASEFAMAHEYPDGHFVQNALVFAPGKTIIESLRELAQVPYDRILPPRLYKSFAADVKLTFTRDGEKDIPVVARSVYNLVVTNTEKIRIQKEAVPKSQIEQLLKRWGKGDEARAEIANLRLQKLASLPNLGVFSDEAHHTYGQALGSELKKVRKTVDYLAQNTKLICVVNTTGTPYYKKQPLRDVVIWYGLSQGIRDGILKEVSNNIRSYSFSDSDTPRFVEEVLEDFYRDYWHVSLPDGSPAKLAIYFPQTDDLENLRPVIEAKLAALGVNNQVVLRNTNESSQAEVDAFNRLNDPRSPHRVILLVNKGAEGWNCPSLFATALARKLKSSNNFVLQAASRCLRQAPGNTVKARIYLSDANRATLDRELQHTYGETIQQLDTARCQSRQATITLRKTQLPKLKVRQRVRTVVRKDTGGAAPALSLQRPPEEAGSTMRVASYTIAPQASTASLLKQVEDTVEITSPPDCVDVYSAAVELAAVYRLDLMVLLKELRRIYPEGELPLPHLPSLQQQIGQQLCTYEVREEEVERALALVRLEGFHKVQTPNGSVTYTAQISYPINREHLLVPYEALQQLNPRDFGFHYTPYNFDSNPEKSFFEAMLQCINLKPDEVEDIYFTGAITDPNKTDFYVEYRADDGTWHRCTPDFIIKRKDGKCLIVEIKDARFREDVERALRGEAVVEVEGRKALALKRWEELNPDRLKYHVIYAYSEAIGYDQMREAREFIGGC